MALTVALNFAISRNMSSCYQSTNRQVAFFFFFFFDVETNYYCIGSWINVRVQTGMETCTASALARVSLAPHLTPDIEGAKQRPEKREDQL